jgi:hypothetical protein
MSFARLLGSLALTLTLPATAAQTLTLSATGLGPDAERATLRALEEAATQALGVATTLDPAFTRQARQWVQMHGAQAQQWSGQPDDQWASLQPLSAFRVLDSTRAADKLRRARVEVRFPARRESPSRSSTLLVTPFRTESGQYPVGGKVPARVVRDQLERHLETRFAQDGQLSVLDEPSLDDVPPEPIEQIKRGHELGADLILVGTIKSFALTTHDQEYMGKEFNTLQPRTVIDYQILNTVTREVVRAGTFSDRKLPESLKQAFDEDEIDPKKEPGRAGEILYPRVARALASGVMETLFPLRVLAADAENSILISSGEGRLREGDLLSAHRIERQVRDSSIDLGIRMESASFATVSVTAVRNDYARGRLVTGEAKALDQGTFLRIQARPDDQGGEDGDRITAP